MANKDMTAVISRCLKGNSFAQEELILAVQDRVYYHCRKMLKDEDRAFDLTQDILMAMLTKLDTLQNPEAFWSWLGGITANLCRNAINRGPRELQIPEDEEGNSLLDTYETMDEQSIPDKALDNDETRRMIAQLVDDLPDAQRQCVLLYYYDELSVKDIAASLQVSENTVKSRLNYARKSIKEGVERYEKQGVKLYGLSPLPFLLFFLGRDAKACGMTAEQASHLPQLVIKNASVAAAAGGAAAAGSTSGAVGAGASAAKAATAAAGKGILGGLSTKVIAAVTAGVVLVSGIGGGILLAGDKENKKVSADTDRVSERIEQVSKDENTVSRDDDLTYMAYVALPDWVDEPFDQIGRYFGRESVVNVAEFSEERMCSYCAPDGKTLVQTWAAPGSDQITMARNSYFSGGDQPIGWIDISLGDSYESVMTKLGLQDIPNAHNFVHCYFYDNDPAESNYYASTAEWSADRKVMFFYSKEKGADPRAQIELVFVNEVLDEFIYHLRLPDDSSAPPADEKVSVSSDPGKIRVEKQPAEPAATPEIQIDGPDAIRLEVNGTYVDGELDICGQGALDEYFWESSVSGYLSVAPGAGFTVTNEGDDENAYVNIWLLEYTKSAESKIIVVPNDFTEEPSFYEVDVMGRYYTRGRGWFLTEQPDGRPAGDGLNWHADINGIVLWNEWDPMVRLYPGQSVTFLLPQDQPNALYNLVLGYIDPEDDSLIPPSKEIYILAQPN